MSVSWGCRVGDAVAGLLRRCGRPWWWARWRETLFAGKDCGGRGREGDERGMILCASAHAGYCSEHWSRTRQEAVTLSLRYFLALLRRLGAPASTVSLETSTVSLETHLARINDQLSKTTTLSFSLCSVCVLYFGAADQNQSQNQNQNQARLSRRPLRRFLRWVSQ